MSRISFSMYAPPGQPSLSVLLDEFCADRDCSRDELLSSARQTVISIPRQAFMHHAKSRGYTYTRIARFLGGRHHTTIIHGVRAHAARLAACDGQSLG